MSKVIAVTSGKGGVGKTGISLNMSLSLAKKGFKVCLFDADLGLANVNIITGLFPEHGLEEVIEGKKQLSDIIIKNYQGIDIVPGSSGVAKMADLTAAQSQNLVRAFTGMDEYDYFIIDTSAGISAQVLSFCRACDEMVLVVTPEPTSLTDAYALLKVLGGKNKKLPVIKVVVNQVKNAQRAQAIYKKLKDTVKRFLSIDLSPLGVLAYDPKVRAAVISQTPFLLAFPNSVASKCVESLAKKLASKPSMSRDMSMELFWMNCIESCNGKVPAPIQKIARKTGDKDVAKTNLPAAEIEKEELAKTLASMEGKITHLSEEVEQMHALLLEFLGTQPFPAGVEAQLASGKNKPAMQKKDDDSRDSEYAMVVPLKTAKHSGGESLKAMEMELPNNPDIQPPKSGKLFFDFEAWLQAKTKS